MHIVTLYRLPSSAAGLPGASLLVDAFRVERRRLLDTMQAWADAGRKSRPSPQTEPPPSGACFGCGEGFLSTRLGGDCRDVNAEHPTCPNRPTPSHLETVQTELRAANAELRAAYTELHSAAHAPPAPPHGPLPVAEGIRMLRADAIEKAAKAWRGECERERTLRMEQSKEIERLETEIKRLAALKRPEDEDPEGGPTAQAKHQIATLKADRDALNAKVCEVMERWSASQRADQAEISRLKAIANDHIQRVADLSKQLHEAEQVASERLVECGKLVGELERADAKAAEGEVQQLRLEHANDQAALANARLVERDLRQRLGEVEEANRRLALELQESKRPGVRCGDCRHLSFGGCGAFPGLKRQPDTLACRAFEAQPAPAAVADGKAVPE